MLLNKFQLHLPSTPLEAAKLYKELDDVKVLAGGTFLLNSLKLLKTKGTRTPKHVLALTHIKGLKGVSMESGHLTIKAMTTVSELFESPLLKDNLSILREVCRNISTNPIRNMATIGGNLTCRYTWTEMGAVMVALDAVMHFLSAQGQVSSCTAEEFFKNGARCDALFTHVTLPHDPRIRVAYRRVKKTLHVDVPLLAVCVSAEYTNERFSRTRVGINNATAFAQRDRVLEEYLNSANADEGLAASAMEHLQNDIYDQRSSEYKQHMFRVSLKQAIALIQQGAS